MVDFTNQLHGSAKRLRYGISVILQALYQGWDIVRVMFSLVALLGMYWEFNKWLLVLRLKTDETRREDAQEETVTNPQPTLVAVAEFSQTMAASTPISTGTGVAVAAHPSTEEPTLVPDGGGWHSGRR